DTPSRLLEARYLLDSEKRVNQGVFPEKEEQWIFWVCQPVVLRVFSTRAGCVIIVWGCNSGDAKDLESAQRGFAVVVATWRETKSKGCHRVGKELFRK
ncbi:MAG: hypothetical protein Q8M03_06285, partial [Legionella sp.]|nr:hypothetical protein [Legionella sp.]